MNITFNCDKRILLTGAGFTANFGAPLGKDIWSFLFSNPQIQQDKYLRDILLHHYIRDDMIEELYFNIISRNGYETPSNSAVVIRNAMDRVFDDIDSVVSSVNLPMLSAVNLEAFAKFIDLISISSSASGFFFTLNQDLFIERWLKIGDAQPEYPGIIPSDDFKWFEDESRLDPITDANRYRLPHQNNLDELFNKNLSTGLKYIKLHGSYNWLASNGQRQLVLGGEKAGQIFVEPILYYNYELFKMALQQDDTKLLCIGYGFNDQHINDVLGNAVKDYGLKLYIVNPDSFLNLKRQLMMQNNVTTERILSGITGYYPYFLRDIFSRDPYGTIGLKRLYRDFIGHEYVRFVE